jgi:hypothetical protein
MSGQSKVAESTDAAAANARALPISNARWSAKGGGHVVLPLSVRRTNLILYGVQKPSRRASMTSTGRRGRPGAGRTLSEDEILDATLSLLDEGGVGRGVGARHRGAGRGGPERGVHLLPGQDGRAERAGRAAARRGRPGGARGPQHAVAGAGGVRRARAAEPVDGPPGCGHPDDRRPDGGPERAGHRGAAARAAGRRRGWTRPRRRGRPTCSSPTCSARWRWRSRSWPSRARRRRSRSGWPRG